LNNRAQNINTLSATYKNNAKQLKKVTKWANWKMNLAIGGVAGSAVGYFIYAMFLK
jgi:hypothetical protein